MQHKNIIEMPDYSCFLVEKDNEEFLMVSGYYEYCHWDLS